jgi:hypothetical protein
MTRVDLMTSALAGTVAIRVSFAQRTLPVR